MMKLAEEISPRSVAQCMTGLRRVLSFLSDLRDDQFTEETLRFLARRLPRRPTSMEIREALDAFDKSQQPKPAAVQERDAWADRQAFLRKDWDDPAAILRKVQQCDGNVNWLRLLASVVAKYAPQHLGLIPPAILERFDDDDGGRIGEELRRAPSRYLDPEMLDRINPLPGGRKRVVSSPTIDAESVANDEDDYPPSAA